MKQHHEKYFIIEIQEHRFYLLFNFFSRKTYVELSGIETEIMKLKSECELFEIPLPSFALIGQCKEELK